MKLKKKSLKEKSFVICTAYLLFGNSDQGKYGSLTTGLSYKYSMSNNGNPLNITDTTDIIR